MKTLLASLSSSLLLCVAPCQDAPNRTRSVEDLLPSSSYACVHLGGLAAGARAAADLPGAAIVRGFLANVPPETREEHVDRELDRIARQVRRVLRRFGFSPADVRALFSCPAALGVGRPTIDGMGLSVALILDLGDDEASVDRLLDTVTSHAADDGLLRIGATEVVAGLEVGSWHLRRGPTLLHARLDGHLIVTNSRGYLDEIASVAAGRAPSLAASSSLGEIRRELHGSTLVSAFVNTEPLLGALRPFLPYEIGDWASALGVGPLKGLFVGSSIGGRGSTDVVHIGLSGNPNGLLKVAESKPLDLSMAGVCSASTVAFGAVRLDVPALVEAFDRFFDVMPEGLGNRARREMRRGFERELRHSGTTPREALDLVRAFGTQATFALSLEKGAIPKPEALVQIEVRDAGAVGGLLEGLMDTLADEEGVEWKEREAAGVTIHFTNVVVDRGLRLSPCFALVEDRLLLGSDTRALMRALRMSDRSESLAAQDDFVAMREATRDASCVLHLRLFRAAELGWRTVETMGFPQIDAHSDELGFDSGALPDGDEVAEALGTNTLSLSVDEEGITLRNSGTLGLGTFLAVLASLGDEILHRAQTTGKIY